MDVAFLVRSMPGRSKDGRSNVGSCSSLEEPAASVVLDLLMMDILSSMPFIRLRELLDLRCSDDARVGRRLARRVEGHFLGSLEMEWDDCFRGLSPMGSSSSDDDESSVGPKRVFLKLWDLPRAS